MNHPSRLNPPIDWSAILGPLLVSGAEVAGGAITLGELAELQSATLAYARRAIRPRPGLADEALPFAVDPVPWFSAGRFLQLDNGQPLLRPGGLVQHAAGDYYIQDAGSMLALALCGVQPGEWVCDACAAPGGKAGGLLEALGGCGLLLANEAIRSRVPQLALTLERSGYGNHLTTNLELEELSRACGPEFDCVLVDAPCTGQTLVGQGKQSLAAFGPTQIAHSAARQQRLLDAAAGLVKPGGRLVYSTCAFSYAENEQVVLDFVQRHPGWELDVCPALADWQSPVASGCYRVWPHRQGCKGAFAARLVHAADAVDSAPAPTHLSGRSSSPRSPGPTNQRWHARRELPAELAWMGLDPAAQWYQTHDQLHRFDVGVPTAWLPVAVAGTPIARCQPAGRGRGQPLERWTPCFGSSLLVPRETQLATCQLDDAQVVAYVAGESIRGQALGDQWCLVLWRGRRLGWGKLSQGTLKNHFPKPLRQAAEVPAAG